MSVHTKLFGVCENKCLVPVYSKEETDELLEKKADSSHTHKAKDISGVALSDHTHTPKSIGAIPYVNVTETGTDLNNYTESGLYYFSSSHTPSNLPFGANGWLLVAGSSIEHYKQLWFRDGTVGSNEWHMATRTYQPSKGWSTWKSLAFCEYDSSTNTLNFIM